MEEVCSAAAEAGDGATQGRALIALAETAVLRDADLERAKDRVARALEVLDDDDLAGRFQALTVRGTIGWAHGHLREEEAAMREALEVARRAGRKDFEAEAADTLASVYLARLEFEKAQPLVDQALLLAEESGSSAARGRALRFAGQLHLARRALDEAESALEAAREYLAEAGAAWALGRTLNYAGWTAWLKGDLGRAEKLFRESIRILTPLEDRATLCESQRGLAQLLVQLGRLAEAERLALAARETVGPQDVTSLSTTTMALGIVRAAQERYDEAEKLLRHALELIEPTDHRYHRVDALEALSQFLRARGRDEEAAALEARREELLAEASSAVRIA
jgi:tetratricopeptide (TPR) repeat protein